MGRQAGGRVTGTLSSRLAMVMRWLLGLVFIIAAVPKLQDPWRFAEVIGGYGILPNALLLPVAMILPLGEIVIGIGVICGRVSAMVAMAVLLLLFIAVLGYGIWLGLDIDCGCFGPNDPEHTAYSGLQTALGRDLLLLIPLTYIIWFARKSSMRKERS